MKNYFLYITFLLLLIIGCRPSVIKVNAVVDENAYPVFGENSSRKFFTNETVSDSLKLIWENDTNGSYYNSSVAVYDRYVFVNDLSGRIFCFNIDDGKVVGQVKGKDAVYTTPLIHKFTAIFATVKKDLNESVLFYYDYVNGKTEKSVNINDRVLSQFVNDEEGIMFATEGGMIFKYDYKGNKLWETETEGRIHSNPAMANSIFVVGNDAGEITAVDTEDGEILYQKPVAKVIWGGVSIFNSNILFGDNKGNLYSLNLTDGSANWKFETGYKIIMTPAYDENNIYVGNLNGDFFSLSKNGKLNWRLETGGVLNATPYITANRIILPDLNEKLYIVDKSTGEITSKITFDGRVKLSPVYSKKRLFLGIDKRTIKAYEFVK